MKIMTILGTRPEIIRLSRIIPLLDRFCEHTLVHTGQNYDRNLNEIFFEDLRLRRPDVVFESAGKTAMEQVAKILVESEQVLNRVRPDRLLLLGDTNSALSAIVAKRMGIPVYHMEAGNRCYDDRVPEEVNRRIIDHSSDILMPYTERSRANLLREGIAGDRIYVTGNPILEVLSYYEREISRSKALLKLGLKRQAYFLATLHRAENVDIPERLASFLASFQQLVKEHHFPLVLSLHPRTRSKLDPKFLKKAKELLFIDPPGLFDFVHLEKNAFCVLSDSGTVQEECCLFQVPNVTIRDVTERPETLESGSNILSGADPSSIGRCVRVATRTDLQWRPPLEYAKEKVADTVVRLVLGFRL